MTSWPRLKVRRHQEVIKSVMDTISLQWMQKLISTGTDGASVMMGRIGGVVSLSVEVMAL